MESPQDNATMPLKDGFNFTPIYNGQRVRMRVGDNELPPSHIRYSPGEEIGYIGDLDTGTTYRLVARACYLPSSGCDAEIMDSTPGPRPWPWSMKPQPRGSPGSDS